MSVANQQASGQMRGVASWSVIAGGAIVLVLITAALTWFAYGALAPRTSGGSLTAAAPATIGDPSLVEFRQGEQGASAPVGGFAPSVGMVEFRRGEQGASVSIGGFTPSAGLVEFREGERTH